MRRIRTVLCLSVVTLCFLVFGTRPLAAQEGRGVSLGIHVLGGARYDNVRMCVGSPAGVPGGPIGEVYFDVRIPAGPDGHVVINIPLFRPIFFAAAFGMLQLEPLVMYEYSPSTTGAVQPVFAGGLGAVLHYGPDYTSGPESPGPSFFAAGPQIAGFAGIRFWEERMTAGAKIFYAPLFSAAHPPGTVAGGGLEVHYAFR
ncbi:MAG: hypothetical protein ACOCYA_03910 [Spirochaetota bacterium]